MTINYLLKKTWAFIPIFLVFMCSPIDSGAQLSGGKLDLSFKNQELSAILKGITAKTDYKFIYSDALSEINSIMSFNYSTDNFNIKSLLDKLFNNRDIVYKINTNQVILTSKDIVPQDGNRTKSGRTIKGNIKDSSGGPLPGITVQNTSKNKISISDNKGEYAIDGNNGDVIVFSCIGMTTVNAIVGNRDIINISMSDDMITLSDVVVTGYQTISKERSSGSYSVVTSEKISNKFQSNVVDRLEGIVPGMAMYKGKLIIRGTSTLYAETSPLYVVDGVPYEGDIENINPDEVANISVLKDATAASIYGARSTNGVIVITTKGGMQGKLNVNYSGNVNFSPLPDRDSYNLMSSSEFVDYQMYLFEKGIKASKRPKNKYALNDVYALMYDKRDGNISDTEFEKEISRLKNSDRWQQTKDEFVNNLQVAHQHNLSFNGGDDFYKYAFSINYQGTGKYDKNKYSDRIGFATKNSFNLNKRLKLEIGIIGSENKFNYNNGVSGYDLLYNGPASYYMLRNERGEQVPWQQEKNFQEVERLKSVGLLDESYFPINELKNVRQSYDKKYININTALTFQIFEGFNAEVRYQTENSASYAKTFWNKNAYKVKNQINNAAQISSTGKITYNIPKGGQAQEMNGREKSYTLRFQLNYSKLFKDKHDFKILAGAERRKINVDENGMYKYGYDDDNLAFKTINETALNSGITSTQSISGSYKLYTSQPAYLSTDDRYVSFYSNASYMFDNKIGVNASIRMDQSNLFGTDPKNQYKPLWSIGANYIAIQNNDSPIIDRLNIRATYGINGNVYKKSGPYIISKVAAGSNFDTNESYSTIVSPPNSALRWEKTKTLNLGVDVSLISGRINGSVDFYNKKTCDMLGYRNSDPTIGWNNLLVNYAAMRNSGLEVSLQSMNVKTKEFIWSTDLLFSYNSNKITSIQDSQESAYSYFYELQARKGKPLNSLYSIRYAGLDSKGEPQAYKADGTIVKDFSKLSSEDLVYSGTYDPPYTASMNNLIRYKNLELSFMFIYYGGHVMRDVRAGYYPSSASPDYDITTNMDKSYLNFWKEAGDEKDLTILPAYKSNAPNSLTYIWRAADSNVKKADFIKLRDIGISYNFPKNLISKINLTNLKITFSAHNIWKWSAAGNKLDPEVWTSPFITSIQRGNAMPPVYTIGLNLSL